MTARTPNVFLVGAGPVAAALGGALRHAGAGPADREAFLTLESASRRLGMLESAPPPPTEAAQATRREQMRAASEEVERLQRQAFLVYRYRNDRDEERLLFQLIIAITPSQLRILVRQRVFHLLSHGSLTDMSTNSKGVRSFFA